MRIMFQRKYINISFRIVRIGYLRASKSGNRMIVLGTLFFFSLLGVERSLNFEIKFEELINADKSERN